MTQARRAPQAIVLTGSDLPDAQELMLHGCEDCACPVSNDTRPSSGSGAPEVADDDALWIRGSRVFELRLDPHHHLLFNPDGSGGAAVVNQLAYQIYRCMAQPTTIGDIRGRVPEAADEVTGVADRLSQLDVVYPADRPARQEFRDGETLTAWLHVTNACNLRCPYCYVSKSSDSMDEHVGHAAADAIIMSAQAHGFAAVKLKYAGGEASLNHRLMLGIHARARELAAERGLRLYATLLSNGVALPRSLVKTLKNEAIRVMISLDGIGEQHDVQRPFASGKPSFRFVERTIAQLIEQDHRPHLSITITSRNARGVADVVRYALERDLTFSLNFFRDNECAESYPDLRYTEQEMISAVLDAFGVIEAMLPRWSVLGSVLDRGQLLQPRQRSCGVGHDYVVIDHNGQVAKCHMEIERTLGDIFSHDPLELVRNDQSTVRNLPVEEKSGCRDCTWRHWCSGGCAVATFRATGRYDIKSPNCNIYKAIYPQALRLEGLRLLKYATVPRTTNLPSGGS